MTADVINFQKEKARRGVAFETGDHVELAAALLNNIDAPAVADLGNLYAYQEKIGIWELVDPDYSSRVIQAFSGMQTIGEPSRKIKIRATDVKGAIQLAHARVGRRGFFDEAPHGLAFANGFLKIHNGTVQIVPHHERHGARFAYPYPCDESATCPLWEQSLIDAFRGDPDPDEKIAAIQEFAGASILGIATRYAKALVLYGFGANAKTVIAEVIGACFPPGSSCSIPPHTWSDEYRMALLAGKLINIVGELPDSDIMDGASFKDTVDGSQKTARQIREAPFTFHPRAGNIFLANKLPGSNDHSHGFWRRVLVITFNRTFQEYEQDVNLADRIIKTELPGVVAWMIKGAKRAIFQGHYTIPSSAIDAMQAWKHASDPISLFVVEKMRNIREASERVSCKEAFSAYTSWAEAGRFKVMSITSFGKRMAGLGFPSEATHDGYVYPLALLTLGEKAPPPVPTGKVAPDPAEDFPRE